MSRIARQYLETSFFHVMVQGINKEYIFKCERYINRYLQLIQKNINPKTLDIIAFCIMNNHAHLLIQIQDIKELSRFMQKVNSIYAKYYNYMENDRVGYVFRDRYKSEPILNKSQLIPCVKYIHHNPVKANMVSKESDYKYSSYNLYVQKTNIIKKSVFTKEDLELICNQEISYQEEFIDVENDIETVINSAIKEFIIQEDIKVFEIFQKDDILKKLIKYLKTIKNIKYTQIMKSLDITKGTMDRLKK